MALRQPEIVLLQKRHKQDLTFQWQFFSLVVADFTGLCDDIALQIDKPDITLIPVSWSSIWRLVAQRRRRVSSSLTA